MWGLYTVFFLCFAPLHIIILETTTIGHSIISHGHQTMWRGSHKTRPNLWNNNNYYVCLLIIHYKLSAMGYMSVQAQYKTLSMSFVGLLQQYTNFLEKLAIHCNSCLYSLWMTKRPLPWKNQYKTASLDLLEKQSDYHIIKLSGYLQIRKSGGSGLRLDSFGEYFSGDTTHPDRLILNVFLSV